VVFAHANIEAGVVNRTALTDNDIASLCSLSAINFNTKAFAVSIPYRYSNYRLPFL